MVINRFEVYLVSLDPTIGAEMQKTRPAVVVSPDELNHHVRTAIIAPLTSGGQRYPSRVPCRFRGKNGQVALDQIRTVDRMRLVKRGGKIDPKTSSQVLMVMVAA